MNYIKKKMKRIVRAIVRKCLFIRVDETVEDGLVRHYYKIKKCLPHRKCTIREFEKELDELNIMEGDTLIVHCAWRGLYALEASPQEVIQALINKVGDNGTVLMPCYSKNAETFDVDNSPSAAGVLSETFRQMPNVVRSNFPKFSMCGYGRDANEIIRYHSNSKYQFDDLSPYSIATKQFYAKVLLLGLSFNTHKITVFHLASYDYRNKSAYYHNCYNKRVSFKNKEGKLVEYIDRGDGYSNNKRIFRKLFSNIAVEKREYNNIKMVSFSALDGYNVAFEFVKNGGKLYKP